MARKKKPNQRNDGKQLEQLVTRIESALIPKGFTIERRSIVYGDEGVQYAEFDIIISGYLGSMPVKYLIECRDRSDAAPGAWIQQLIGRKQLFGFHNVMAVSASGFSPGAEAAAMKGEIELRTVESLTVESIAEWIPMQAPLLLCRAELKKWNLTVGDIGQTPNRQSIRDDTPIFDVSWAAARQSAKDLWALIMSLDAAWHSVPADGTSIEQAFFASEHLPPLNSATIDGVTFPIHSVELVGSFSHPQANMPLTDANRYADALSKSGDHKGIADTFTWKGDGHIFDSLSVTLIRKQRADADSPD